MDFQDYEDQRQRATPDVRTSIILYRRVYNFPPGATAIIPTKGEAVSLRDVTGTGISTPRVYTPAEQRSLKNGGVEVHMLFYQIRPYA